MKRSERFLQTLEKRFWRKIDARGENECWDWLGWLSGGYGRLCITSKTKLAHRVCWELIYGPIPEGLCVLHSCDNRACVNPEHLFLGTGQDNMDDMYQKGREYNPIGIDHWHAKYVADAVSVSHIRKWKGQ